MLSGRACLHLCLCPNLGHVCVCGLLPSWGCLCHSRGRPGARGRPCTPCGVLRLREGAAGGEEPQPSGRSTLPLWPSRQVVSAAPSASVASPQPLRNRVDGSKRTSQAVGLRASVAAQPCPQWPGPEVWPSVPRLCRLHSQGLLPALLLPPTTTPHPASGLFLPALPACPAALALMAPLESWGVWSPLNLPSTAVPTCQRHHVRGGSRPQGGGPTAAQTVCSGSSRLGGPLPAPAQLRSLLPLAAGPACTGRVLIPSLPL